VYSRKHFEHTASSIGTLGREELKKRIKGFRGGFRLDFTDDYLDHASVERLRHILMAALITARTRH
jgi:hypothetical protein